MLRALVCQTPESVLLQADTATAGRADTLLAKPGYHVGGVSAITACQANYGQTSDPYVTYRTP